MIPMWLLIYFVICNSFISEGCLPSSSAHYKLENKTGSSSPSLNKRIFLFAETFTSFLRKFILGNSQNKLKFFRQRRKTLHEEDSIDKLVLQVKDLTNKTIVRTGNGNKTSNIMHNNDSDVGNNLLKTITKLLEGKQTDVTVRNDEDNRNMSKIVISYKYQGKKSNVDKDVYDDDEEEKVEEERFEADKEEEDEEVEDDVEKEKKEKLKKNVLKEMESTLGLTAKKIRKDKTFATIIMKQTIIIDNKTLPVAKTHRTYKTKVKVLNRLNGKYVYFKFPKSHSDRKGVPSSKHKNYMHNISFSPILPSAKDHLVKYLQRSKVDKLKAWRIKRLAQNKLFVNGGGNDDRLLLVKPKLMKPFKFHSEANIDFHIRTTNFTQDEVPVDISIDNTHSKTSGQR